MKNECINPRYIKNTTGGSPLGESCEHPFGGEMREQKYEDMHPKGNTTIGGTVTVTGTTTFPIKSPCICGEFTADPKFSFVAVTFNCPYHGSVTVDRRMTFGTYPIYTIPNQTVPYTPPVGPVWISNTGINSGR